MLHGRVFAAETKPIPNAVVFGAKEYEHNSEPALVGRTDAAGLFQIAVPDATSKYRVRIQAPGFAAHVVRYVELGRSLEMTLSSGDAIEGVVRDRDTRRPIPNADLEA